MKSYLKARPVYLSNEDRIKAHFLINFTALVVLKILQKKLRSTLKKEDTTIDKIVASLRELEITKIADSMYVSGNVSDLEKNIFANLDLKLNKKFLKQKYLIGLA